VFLKFCFCLSQDANERELEKAAQRMASIEREIAVLISAEALSSEEGHNLMVIASKAGSVQRDLRQLLYNMPFSLRIPPILRPSPARQSANATLVPQAEPVLDPPLERKARLDLGAQSADDSKSRRAREQDAGDASHRDEEAAPGAKVDAKWQVRRSNGTVYTTVARRGRAPGTDGWAAARSHSSWRRQPAPSETWGDGDEEEDEEDVPADAEGRCLMLEEGERVVARARALLGLVTPTPDDARGVEKAVGDLQVPQMSPAKEP